MKKIGMIGGFGPESTLDYYRLIIDSYRQTNKENYPEIIINSMDIHVLMNLVAQEKWQELTSWLVDGIEALYRGGADFGFISANTPHIVYEQVQSLSPIPLISIVEATCNKVQELGISNIALIGTKFTMKSTFYQKVFSRKSINIVVPVESEIEYIHCKLMEEIEIGIFSDETRNGLLNIIQRMIYDNGIEGVILGCTELPLILTKSEFGIPFINTTMVHVESVLNYCKECQ